MKSILEDFGLECLQVKSAVMETAGASGASVIYQAAQLSVPSGKWLVFVNASVTSTNTPDNVYVQLVTAAGVVLDGGVVVTTPVAVYFLPANFVSIISLRAPTRLAILAGPSGASVTRIGNGSQPAQRITAIRIGK